MERMSEKLGPVGCNTGGGAFDDGIFDGVKKVTVGKDFFSVTYIKIEYEKDGKIEIREHGTIRGELKEFTVDYPNEYITAIGGSYDHVYAYGTVLIKSLIFKTSYGRTSPTLGMTTSYGTPARREFMLEGKNGGKLLGFHGRSGQALDALGAHFAPFPTPAPASVPSLAPYIKLPAQGGRVSWDDGVYDNVRKVHVGHDDSGVTFVKFEYHLGSKLLSGESHGKKSLLETKEFPVDQDDYIISVKGYYKKLSGSDTEVISGSDTEVEQKSDGPGPRCSHAIAMVGDKMYSFGGELKPNFHIDKHLYVFDFKTHTWSVAPPNGHVPDLACLGVCMVAIGSTLYVFGGRDGNRKYNGFYSYDTVKSEWKLLTHVDKGPEPRSFHAMAADDKNIYVFGGVSSTKRLNTFHAYNIFNHKWTDLPNPGESCKPRGGAGLAVVHGKIWVVYGFTGDEMDDVHCFDPAKSKWTKVETSGEKPWARSVFAIAVLGKYILISGGEIDMDPEAHMGPGKLTGGAFVLDTESLMWEKLEEGHSPRGWCASTTASIDGKKGLLMYGGKALTNGRYNDIFFYGVDNV